MQVTETLSEGLKRAYTVVVPAADIEGRRSAKLNELGKTLRLPGFRPGKVPMTVVRQRYGTAVLSEVLEESVSQATSQVLSDRGLRPAVQPKIDVVTLDTDKDLEFKIDVELLPEIPMPDFAAISLTRLKTEAPDEAIDKALTEIASRQGKLEDVTESRPAQKGDVLSVDFLGRVDGTPFAGGEGKDMNVEVGGTGFIPGFTEQLEGMVAGETRTIDVTFPAEYHAAELAAKPAQFEITAKKLQTPLIPAVDEDLAKTLGFEGLEEVRKTLRTQMQREYDQLARLRLKRALLDALAGQAAFEAPEAMVQAEFDQIWSRVEADRKDGKLEDDDKDKDEDTLKGEYRAIAERRVKLGLLLSEIGRANGITVGNDEMTRAMRNEASRYPGQEQQVMEFFRKNPQAAEGLRGPLFEDKVVDFVLELAKVEEKQVTPEELSAESDAA
ncbi:MAG TPA: trigger factor [Candidatus Limnocylindria bacterium]|nr:trigger factor [Candidatus Limnocylindria bacterium]